MLRTVYREHFGFVWALVRRLGVGERDVEDAVQDVFIVVHRRLHDFEERAAIRTWLYAITMRVAANYRRRHRRRAEHGDADLSRLAAPPSSDPEAHARRSEAAEILDRLLSRLDEKKRAVFVLAEIEGLPAPEIAKIVGTNPRTVYSRLRAARARFGTDLARLSTDGAPDRMAPQWVRDTAAQDRPPHNTDKRVWAALMLRLPGLGTGGAAASVSMVKAVAAAGAIAVVALGALATAGRYWAADAGVRRPAIAAKESTGRSDPPPSVHAASQGTSAAVAEPLAVVDRSSPLLPTPSSPARRSNRRREAAPRKTAAVPAARPTQVEPGDALFRELGLVDKTRRALAAGHAAEALAMSRQHAERFPDGKFRRESDRSRVAALCALGRERDAETHALQSGVPKACGS